MIILETTIIAVIICFLIDLSGIITTIKQLLWKWVFGKGKPFQDFNFKPFECSLCMVHHTLFIYLLATGQLTLINYFVVCLLSFFSTNITALLMMIKETLIKIEGRIYNLIDRI